MKRVRELDGLRGLAAVVVIWLHAATICPALRFGPLLRWGSTAVDLFFVISGYLITTIILESGGGRGFLSAFYARRALRIWPIYYGAILGFAALNLVLPRPFPTDGLGYYLAYLQGVPSYWGERTPEFCKAFAHTWSLAVEEQFYLVWPALVLWLGRQRLASACVATVALAVAARAWGGWDFQVLLTRCDGLALGALLAIVLSNAEGSGCLDRCRSACLVVAGTALGVVVVADWVGVSLNAGREETTSALIRGMKSLALLACNLGFAGLVGVCVCVSGSRSLAILRGRRLCGLGTISYGLYLYHNILLGLVHKRFGRPNLSVGLTFAALAATLLLAMVSWRFVEKPILTLKGRFRYDRPSLQETPTAVAVSGA